MFICDAHCDTLYKRVTETNAAPDVTLERLQEAGVTLQTLALFSGPDPLFDRAVQLNAAMRHEFLRLKEEEGWIQITDLKELKEGQVAFLLSLEGCQVLTPGLSCVDEFYEIGVRMMSLTWNHENALATSHNVNQHDGLKAFGLDVVKHCQQLGIMIDVSHLNDAGVQDVLRKTDVPPLASHIGCRSLMPASRNMSDRNLKDLFKAGGFVGVYFLPYLLTEGEATIEHVVDHIDHLMAIGGEGKIGIGSDFDGMSKKIEGLEHPGQLKNLFLALEKRGYRRQDIDSIAGKAFIDYATRVMSN